MNNNDFVSGGVSYFLPPELNTGLTSGRREIKVPIAASLCDKQKGRLFSIAFTTHFVIVLILRPPGMASDRHGSS